MMLGNSSRQYGLVAKLLHWLVALLILALIPLGNWLVRLDYFDRWYFRALEWHKALGIIVLALAAVRIVWSLFNPAPVPNVSGWQRWLASATHRVLLLLTVLVPLAGYGISTAAGDGVSVFGIMDVPAPLPKNESLRHWTTGVHYWTAYLTAALILLHVAAALKHHFLNRDDTLRRML